MQHETFELAGVSGEPLFAQRWRPETASWGAIGIVHGLGEHSNRHADLASQLTSLGLTVVAFDHRGHGRSAGKRGHVSHYGQLMDDLAVLEAQLLPQGSPGARFFLGQSLGANLVLNYGLRRPTHLQGLVASSPLIEVSERPGLIARTAIRSLSKLWPAFPLKTGIRAEDLAPDRDIRQGYVQDELVHGRVSARLAVEAIDAGAWALRHAAELALPTLLLHGDADRITSFGASQAFAAACPRTCEFVAVHGGRHELLQGDSGKPTVKQVLQWLARHRGA